MTTYDVGDAATLGTSVYNASGALTDATVSLSVTAPDGTTSAPSVTHAGTGVYSATVSVSQSGTWFYTWTVSGAVTAVDSGQFTAANPAPPAYATLTELKTTLRITDSTDDVELQAKLLAASRRVDRDCGRRFWSDRTTSSRIYTPHHEELLPVNDIATSTGLVVEVGRASTWTTVASNAYDLLPENAEADSRAIEVLTRVLGYWPMWGLQRVRVTARWGWPAVPEEIKNAAILLAARLFRRKDSPEGVQGFADLGVVRVSRYDPDYDAFIGPYVRDVK